MTQGKRVEQGYFIFDLGASQAARANVERAKAEAQKSKAEAAKAQAELQKARAEARAKMFGSQAGTIPDRARQVLSKAVRALASESARQCVSAALLSKISALV